MRPVAQTQRLEKQLTDVMRQLEAAEVRMPSDVGALYLWFVRVEYVAVHANHVVCRAC
jgi:hypothetical protein